MNAGILPLAATLGLIANLAQAEGYWEYGDWRVSVTEQSTTEDYRLYCRASTGGDGMPVISLQISNGDAGPPNDYPAPTFFESAPRHHNTQVVNAQGVSFVFDHQGVFFAVAEGGIDDEGIAWASAAPRWQDTKNMLLWMKASSQMEVRALDAYSASTEVYVASLAGFTAAYGKMMDSCGHSLDIPRD
ncbi:hypothetical protein [Phaeobacter sp. HF9A]|uniref:hypothetical protein n=1 Tax=Phaeobacter sp. HF9A TaxID=2721561 RepID=UPI0020CA4736|nr:hypothetical protein [Phaeobacter sp. HF9A]